MKKILTLFLFLVLFIPVCKCEEFKEEIPKNKKVIIYEEEERYRWYKLKRVNYKAENAIENNCEYFDNLPSNFSEWSENKPEEASNRIIESKIELINGEYNVVLIEDFLIDTLEIQEVKLYDMLGNEISYKVIECRNCNSNYESYNNMKDSNYLTTIGINYNTVLVLKLEKEYKENIITYISYNHNKVMYGWTVRLLLDYKTEIKKIKLNYKDMVSIYSPIYNAYKNNKNSEWIINQQLVKEYYRYKDELVNCFEYEKEYLNGYFTNVEDYIKDENSKKTFYKYEEINLDCPDNNAEKLVLKEENEESNKMISVNYSNKNKSKEFSKVPIFIVTMSIILALLITICKKMKMNIKNSR